MLLTSYAELSPETWVVCLPYPHLVDVDHIPLARDPSCLPAFVLRPASCSLLVCSLSNIDLSAQITAPFLHTSFKSDFSSDVPTSKSVQGPLTGHARHDLHSCPLPLARIHLELRCAVKLLRDLWLNLEASPFPELFVLVLHFSPGFLSFHFL